MAVEVRYVGTRGVDQWSELNYNERNLIENGFFNEFKLAMANLQANNAAGGSRARARSPTSARAPARTRCRSTSPTSTAARDAGNAAAYTAARHWTQHRAHAGSGAHQPAARRTRRPISTATSTRRANCRWRPACPRTSSSSTRMPTNVNVTDSGAFSDYHALQIELRRRLSHGLAFNAKLPVRARGRLGVPRVPLRPRDEPDRQRPPRDQGAVGLDDSGRPRRAVRQQHASDPERHRRRLAVQRRQPHPGAHGQLRQRAAGRA